jgi:hypothetical protein
MSNIARTAGDDAAKTTLSQGLRPSYVTMVPFGGINRRPACLSAPAAPFAKGGPERRCGESLRRNRRSPFVPFWNRSRRSEQVKANSLFLVITFPGSC